MDQGSRWLDSAVGACGIVLFSILAIGAFAIEAPNAGLAFVAIACTWRIIEAIDRLERTLKAARP